MIFLLFLVSKFCISPIFRKFCKNRKNSRFSRGPRIFQFQQILQLRANLHICNSAKYSSNKTSHTHSEPFFPYLQFNNAFLFFHGLHESHGSLARRLSAPPRPTLIYPKTAKYWYTLFVNQKLVLGFQAISLSI